MSHVSKIELVVKDLDALERAASKLGCELIRGQKNYRWWGTWEGDYPLPEGVTKEELGKCDHVVRVKNNDTAYELGVVKNKNKSGYSLLYDFYGRHGRDLEAKVGQQCGILKQEYTVQALLNKVKNKQKVKNIEESKEGNKRKITITLH